MSIVLALVTVSCHASYPTAPSSPTIVAVQVQYSRAMSYASVGTSYAFDAYAIRSDGGWEYVTASATWASSDSQVMSPAGGIAGTFNTVSPGQADVTATYRSVVGRLSIPAIRADRSPYPRLYIYGGNPHIVGANSPIHLTFTETATSSEQDVTNLATWTSANTTVVTVGGGVVTAVGPGTTVIRATYNGQTLDYGLSVLPRSR